MNSSNKFVSVLLCFTIACAILTTPTSAVERLNQVSDNYQPLTSNSVSTYSSTLPYGTLDVVDTYQIGGWAYQNDYPDTPINVHIYIINNSTGETSIIGITANGWRQDLYNGGYGNGYHCFSYNVDWYDYPAGTYTVHAYAIDINGNYNPELAGSPKSFTVGSMYGNVEYLNENGIGGWAYKPDAPDRSVDVHIYVRKSDGTDVAFYPTTASQYRSDLYSLGYGNGYHGFSYAIDWSTLPKEELKVTAYAVDQTGYHPAFFDGYYNNADPHGSITLYGINHNDGSNRSAYYTDSVKTAISNIGVTQTNGIYGYVTASRALYRMKTSMIWIIHTHGNSKSVTLNNLTDGKTYLYYSDIAALPNTAFSYERCVIYGTCNAGEGGANANNMVNITYQKGAMTVIGWQDTTLVTCVNTWLEEFLVSSGKGNTISQAVSDAIQKVYSTHGDFGGLDNVYIQGSTTQKLVS